MCSSSERNAGVKGEEIAMRGIFISLLFMNWKCMTWMAEKLRVALQPRLSTVSARGCSASCYYWDFPSSLFLFDVRNEPSKRREVWRRHSKAKASKARLRGAFLRTQSVMLWDFEFIFELKASRSLHLIITTPATSAQPLPFNLRRPSFAEANRRASLTLLLMGLTFMAKFSSFLFLARDPLIRKFFFSFSKVFLRLLMAF